MTKKQKILFYIPLGIILTNLAYSWGIFILTDSIAVFGHYLGSLFMVPIVYLLFKDDTYKLPIILLGIYLVLASVNLLSFFPFIMSNSVGIKLGTIEILTPSLNGLSLLLFIFYGVLNFDTLTDIYLDYKESKKKS